MVWEKPLAACVHSQKFTKQSQGGSDFSKTSRGMESLAPEVGWAETEMFGPPTRTEAVGGQG